MTALFDVDVEDSGEEFSPGFSFGALGFLRGLNSFGSCWSLRLHFLGHDERSKFGMRCEAAKKSSQMNPRRGNECREFFHELQSRKEQMACAIGVLRFELEDNVATGQLLEALFAHCGSGDIAAKFFKFVALPGRGSPETWEARELSHGALFVAAE